MTYWFGRRPGDPRRAASGWGGLLVAAVATGAVCVPSVSTERLFPPDLPQLSAARVALPTGSNVTLYHYPALGLLRYPLPVVYLHGGPVRGIALLDHRFFAELAERGYDVYLYEQAGAGRSGLLPLGDYSIDRQGRDFDAVLDVLGAEQVDVVGFSAGGTLLTRALATPHRTQRIHAAVIAEPGPMDGPTAALDGPPSVPTAATLAPAPTGPRSTTTPRYAVAFGLMRLGFVAAGDGLVGQAEALNAFTPADLGSDTANSYCAADAWRIPIEDSPAKLLLQSGRVVTGHGEHQAVALDRRRAGAQPDSGDAAHRGVFGADARVELGDSGGGPADAPGDPPRRRPSPVERSGRSQRPSRRRHCLLSGGTAAIASRKPGTSPAPGRGALALVSTEIRQALRAELTAAMKRRDRVAMGACRSALGAIDNAESEGVAAPRAGAIETSAVGIGAAEAARRVLTEPDLRAVVAAEVAERRSAAAELPASVADRAAELRAEAAVLEHLLEEV